MQKITPFLWYNDSAEAAVDFYLSVFKNGSKKKVARYGDAGPGPKGSVMTIEFEVNGLNIVALNGGPQFSFTEAVSFVVECKDQAEVDYFWKELSEGGEKSMCGWLKDKFGLWWQVVPKQLPVLLTDPDSHKSQKVMEAMLKMDKIEISKLEEAYSA